jgi:hypothetical protein
VKGAADIRATTPGYYADRAAKEASKRQRQEDEMPDIE